MARLAVLEETQTKRDERRDERRAFSEEERVHSQKISENYRKLLFDNAEAWVPGEEAARAPRTSSVAAATLERTAPAALNDMAFAPVHEAVPGAPARDEVPMNGANTAQRLADYVAYAPPAGKKMLFEGIEYKNGELIDAAVAAPAAPAAPTIPEFAPVYTPAQAPTEAPAEEDAMPTARTMETLHRAEAAVQDETRTGLFASLSTATKAVLCAVIAAIVLAVVLICINTGILSSVNANIAVKSNELQELTQEYADIREEIDAIEDPSAVAEWAQENGMVSANGN